MLPAVFFSPGAKGCRSCKSDYDRRRSAAAPQREPVAEKECARCHQLLPASDFQFEPVRLTGLSSWCKTCTLESVREGWARNAAAPLPAAALAPTKTCTSCKQTKLRAEFHALKRTWDGLNHVCKFCRRAHEREHHARRV